MRLSSGRGDTEGSLLARSIHDRRHLRILAGRVSISFWRDEESVRRWREREEHRTAQARGRNGVFTDYRLRVACVLRDYGMKERAQAPEDSRRRHG